MLVQQITCSTPCMPAPAIKSGAIPRVAASSLRQQLLMEWCMLVPGIAICMHLMPPQEPYYGASPPAIGLAPRQRLPAAWSIPVHRIICSTPSMHHGGKTVELPDREDHPLFTRGGQRGCLYWFA